MRGERHQKTVGMAYEQRQFLVMRQRFNISNLSNNAKSKHPKHQNTMVFVFVGVVSVPFTTVI